MRSGQERLNYCEGCGSSLKDKKQKKAGRTLIEDQDNIYVIDTSVFICDPDIPFKLGSAGIIVPLMVLKELKGLTRNQDVRRARAAQRAVGTLDMLGCTRRNESIGVRTYTGAMVSIFSRFVPIGGCEITADEKIIGTALRYKQESGVDVTILTNDRKMRNISLACGLRAEQYPFQLHATVNDSAAVKESLSGAQKKVA